MNIFRLLADSSHLVAIFILLHKIWKTHSVAGLSGKSQILFAIVFLTRYLDLFTTYISLYNTVMKLVFISSSLLTVYLIYRRFRATYEILILPCIILALFVNHKFTVVEILWTFSIYLEAVAIMPQLFMLQQATTADSITSHYLFALGVYRMLYIFNWIARFYTESFFDSIAVVSGIVQTVLYVDFFYLYVQQVLPNRLMNLPN